MVYSLQHCPSVVDVGDDCSATDREEEGGEGDMKILFIHMTLRYNISKTFSEAQMHRC